MIKVEHALALGHRINTVPFQGIPLGGTLNHLIMTRYGFRRPLSHVISRQYRYGLAFVCRMPGWVGVLELLPAKGMDPGGFPWAHVGWAFFCSQLCAS